MAQKRGNGEGSIYRRKDGRWVGQYLVHTDKCPKYRYLYGKTAYAEAAIESFYPNRLVYQLV